MILEFSHHLVTLPAQPMSFGLGWNSVADVRDKIQELREFLRQPEQMALLAIMGRLAVDQTLSNPAALQGRILTFDDTSLTSPMGIT